MNLRSLLCVIAMVLCSACLESIKVQDQASRLTLALTHYGADLRWGRYHQAYGYHVQRDGSKPQVNLERLEDYSVTSFTPIEPVLNAEATEAIVPFEMKYYDEQFGMLRTLKETQKWWFDVKTSTWHVESDFPILK